MGTGADLLFDWEAPDGEWGCVFSDGAVMTSGDTATTPDQAERIIDALCRAHGFMSFNYDFWAKRERQDG